MTPSVPATVGEVPGFVNEAAPRTTYLIGRLDRIVRRALDECLREFGLTVLAYTSLTVLQARPRLSNAQLARRSFMTPQGMNQVIAVLLDKGLVQRSPSPANRRVQHLELTELGTRVVEQCTALVIEYEDHLLGALDPAEREQLNRTLRTIVDANRRHPPATAGAH